MGKELHRAVIRARIAGIALVVAMACSSCGAAVNASPSPSPGTQGHPGHSVAPPAKGTAGATLVFDHPSTAGATGFTYTIATAAGTVTGTVVVPYQPVPGVAPAAAGLLVVSGSHYAVLNRSGGVAVASAAASQLLASETNGLANGEPVILPSGALLGVQQNTLGDGPAPAADLVVLDMASGKETELGEAVALRTAGSSSSAPVPFLQLLGVSASGTRAYVEVQGATFAGHAVPVGAAFFSVAIQGAGGVQELFSVNTVPVTAAISPDGRQLGLVETWQVVAGVQRWNLILVQLPSGNSVTVDAVPYVPAQGTVGCQFSPGGSYLSVYGDSVSLSAVGYAGIAVYSSRTGALVHDYRVGSAQATQVGAVGWVSATSFVYRLEEAATPGVFGPGQGVIASPLAGTSRRFPAAWGTLDAILPAG